MHKTSIFLFLLFASCGFTTNSGLVTTGYFEDDHRPHILFQPVEDRAKTAHSMQAAALCTQAITQRLGCKNRLSISTSPMDITSAKSQGKQFIVFTQLVQHEEGKEASPELSVSIHLKILDIRSESPKVLFQEVLNHQTVLLQPLDSDCNLEWQDENVRLSPLGLLYTKLSREIAEHIEKQVFLLMGLESTPTERKTA